jgi:putative transcriptional regulator
MNRTGSTRRALLRGWGVALALVLAACSDAPPAGPTQADERDPNSLAGQFLVATPSVGDARFAGTVILMVRHDTSGAFGLVVNRAAGRGSAAKLLEAVGIAAEGQGQIRVHYGGPVQSGSGFIVHTPDRRVEKTVAVTPSVAVTTDPAILKEIAAGVGPRQHFIAFGYAGWGPGQLEGEIARQAWVTAPADERIIFDDDMDTKWRRALEARGIAL